MNEYGNGIPDYPGWTETWTLRSLITKLDISQMQYCLQVYRYKAVTETVNSTGCGAKITLSKREWRDAYLPRELSLCNKATG